jgi:hypothetical protein
MVNKMTTTRKSFYVKIKIDKEYDTMKSLIVSEDLEAIKKWSGAGVDSTDPKTNTGDGEKSIFLTVSTDFEKSISAFQSSAPFIMNTMPIMRRQYDDISVRAFAKKHGHELENGEFELYEIDFEHFSLFSKRLEQTSEIASGIKQLPNLFLLGLISTYDAFLSQLIRAIFIVKPDTLSSSEKTISIKELMEIGSVEAARNSIIEKEVEAVIRTSHSDQIEWLEKKLGIKLKTNLAIWPDFIEVCERRNLLTHTDGVVSSNYIKVCTNHGYNSSVNCGDKLVVDNSYFNKAVSIIFEMGMKLTQVVWRKLIPSELPAASGELNDIIYRLVVKRKYKSAVTMSEFGLNVMKKHGSDAIKKMMIVNYANALKLSGKKDQFEKVLDAEDWSSATDAYKICVYAVKNDVDSVIGMLKSVVDTKLISIGDIREWPVFHDIRTDMKFIEAFERIFGEKLLADKEGVRFVKTESAKHSSLAAETNSEHKDDNNYEEQTVH